MIRKSPHCRKCNTPMKGHLRGKCRSSVSNNVVVVVKDEKKNEWKPLANKTWWEYYRNWQDNSLSVPFPTRMGMSPEQLGDIMENYSKYVIFYQ